MLPITDRPDAPGSLAFTASHSFGFSRSEWLEVAELMAPQRSEVIITPRLESV
jgi:hypothetical protein